jgi:predicted Zn-dependent protease
MDGLVLRCRHGRRHFLSGMAAATLCAGLPACGTVNPATGRSSFTGVYSVEDDIKLGQDEHGKIVKEFGGEYENRKLQAYVDGIGKTLALHTEFQQFPYKFTILNTPIVNAFALPGGFVYVSRGLLSLASDEAELAGVVAHEIGHVNARHTAERLSAAQVTQLGLLAGAIGAAVLGLPQGVMQVGQSIAAMSIQSYSRSQELEADTLGIRYMSRAGYDPQGMVTFLDTLREHSMIEAQMQGLPPGTVDEYNVMATHPRTIERVEEAMKVAATARPANPKVARDAYLDHIDGMLFGDDPRQGLVRGRLFQHPVLRFEFRVPEGFRILNGETKVMARDQKGSAMLFDTAPIKSSRTMAAYLQGEWAAKTPLRNVETIDINGLEAATGWVRAQDRQRGAVDIRVVAIRRDAASAYRFLFLTPASESQRLSQGLRETTYSFRTLSAAEAGRIRAHRLLVVPAQPGDTVQGLAKTLPYDAYNEAWFRVLNDLKPGQPLPAKRRIKVVAG